MALTGGEDYELILVGPQDVMDKYIDGTDMRVTVIGRVEDGEAEVTVVDERGNGMTFDRGGWDHLAAP